MSPTSPKRAVFEQFAAIAKALGHPNRLELLESLAQGERSVERLAAFDLRFSRLTVLDENDEPLTVSDREKEMLRDTIVWNWEEVQLRSAETRAKAAR